MARGIVDIVEHFFLWGGPFWQMLLGKRYILHVRVTKSRTNIGLECLAMEQQRRPAFGSLET